MTILPESEHGPQNQLHLPRAAMSTAESAALTIVYQYESGQNTLDEILEALSIMELMTHDEALDFFHKISSTLNSGGLRKTVVVTPQEMARYVAQEVRNLLIAPAR